MDRILKPIFLGVAVAVSFIKLDAQTFKLNDKDYFENYDANVMVFSDVYPEGHQGGVTLVSAGDRLAANGDVRFEISQGQWQGLPKLLDRNVDRHNNEIRVTLAYPDSSKHLNGFNPAVYPDFAFNYTIRVRGEGDHVVFSVLLDKPVPERFAGKLGLNVELTPSLLLGKPWIMDEKTGIFPHQPFGPTIDRGTNMEHIGDFYPDAKGDVNQLLGEDFSIFNPMRADDIVSAPLAEGRIFTLNPQDELKKITFEALKGTLKLYDGRINHNNGWFILRTELQAGETSAEWKITPETNPSWRHQAVVQTSQIGYHPRQNKIAVIELDAKDTDRQDVVLYRITSEGKKEVRHQAANEWGRLFRYNYLQFDFSDIKEEGLYQVCYGDSESSVFRIANDVWHNGVWQAEIEYFLPVQMCHMRVNEKYRVWHDRCHDDDALMAKTDINHIDGYIQGPETLCGYKPGEHVPGLNVGGWHDAGDYDLRIESQASQAYLLAMQVENLGAYWDETSIDFDKHIVEIHQPDGINDYLQQVENGVISILAGWKALGRLYRGILCPTVRQYTHLGDASAHTDGICGNWDDRWVFTEDNPGRELTTATQLAAIARVIKDYKPEMAAECLGIARTLYCDSEKYESQIAAGPESGFKTYMLNAVKGARIHCAVELYLTTGEKQFKDYVLSEKDYVVTNIRNTAWYIGRFDKAVKDKKFSKAIREALEEVKAYYDGLASRSPYGVPYDMGNRSSGSWEPQSLGYHYCWLYQSYPEVFGLEYMLSSMQYLLGMHPGSYRASLVTGVGAETVKAAYGVNRADWSYIPGGVVPGTNLIRPDLPELLEFPFLWQEGEYCIGGYTTHVSYMAMAADKFLNEF